MNHVDNMHFLIRDYKAFYFLSPLFLWIPSLIPIPYKDDLIALFEPLGPLKNVSIAGKDGKSRGFAFVKFAFPEDSEKAIETLQGTELKGR